MTVQSVLVITDDDVERERIGSWLEDAGFGVLGCPGPTAPDYTCLGSRGDHCPLAEAADVVVLDMRLGSDEAMAGTPGWELLLHYVDLGRGVVALSDPGDVVRVRSDDRVAVVSRPPERRELIAAVRVAEVADVGKEAW